MRFRKYLWLGIFTAVLSALALLSAVVSQHWYIKEQPRLPLTFSVPSGAESETVTCWSEDGDHYYVFLPSYAELGQVRARLGRDAPDMSLNGIPLEDGTACEGLSLNETYSLRIKDRDYLLEFLQSSNVATICVETESGTMAYLHKNKEKREKISITAYTTDGTVDYHSEDTDEMKGRGNSTWKKPKRPYNLLFSEPVSLLGMEESQKWCLLANAIDATNLRNWLIYDLASRVGFRWSPKVMFVDLYLNGDYAGLYLLVEAITIEENRLDLPEGSFLFDMDYQNRLNFETDPAFLTEMGQALRIEYPKQSDERQVKKVSDHVRAFEHAIASPEGVDPETGKSWEELIDVDSWVRKYLIEEISENLDSGMTSQYFTLETNEEGEQVLTAGPVWDYDLTLGNYPHEGIKNPRCFYAAQTHVQYGYRPWYGMLYKKEGFYQRVRELYCQEFLPLLEEYTASGLAEKAAEISDAAFMNRVRWNEEEHFSEGEAEVARLEHLFTERVDFLTDAWRDGVRYCNITLTRDDGQNFAVFCAAEYGKKWEDFQTPEDYGMEGSVWYLRNTGEAFDPETPVTEDLVLKAPSGGSNSFNSLTSFAKEAVEDFPPKIFGVFLALLLAGDILRHRKKRR